MIKKKVDLVPKDYVVVEFTKNYSPYIKGDITAIPRREYSYLTKVKAVIKL
jgi:hypothetical protein